MKPTLNVVIRKSNSDQFETGTLYLRLTINRKSKYYSCGISISMKAWDQDRQVITLRDPDFRKKNELLELFFTRADGILHDLRMDSFDNPVSFDQFENKFHTRKITMLADFAEIYIQDKKTILEQSTINRYNSSITKIRAYGNVSLSGINYNWLQAYETHLRNNLGMMHNTVAKEIKFIKSVYHEAQRRELVAELRPLDYSINYQAADKDFLTIDELKTLIFKLRDPDFEKNLKRVLYYFIFSCLTGLRISDIKNLKVGNFNKDYSMIDIVTVKTKDRIQMPLSQPAQKIVKDYMKFESKRFKYMYPELPFFKVHSDQHNNIVLPNIMLLCDIKKTIRYHNSRHTFATICNELGLPIAVTSRLMTHKTLRMTLQYAKFNDPTLKQNIEKWDNLMKTEENPLSFVG